MEIDIIPRTETQERAVKGKRAKRKKESEPKQRNLNDKNAKRYFKQLVQGNFGEDDFHVSATYSNKYLPKTLDEAEKIVYRYLRRINYKRKKEGLGPIKYVLVTEYKTEKDNDKPIRIHHHIFINKGLNRDTLEDLWSERRKAGEKKGEKLGFINCDRLQPDERGLEAISKYLMKDPKGKKRWSSSRNLDRPCSITNDYKYSKRQVSKMAREPLDKDYWEKQYKGYKLIDYKPIYNDDTGWSIYLVMWRKDDS